MNAGRHGRLSRMVDLCAAPWRGLTPDGGGFFGHSRSGRWLLVALLAMATLWCFVDVRQRGRPTPAWEHRSDLTVYTGAGAAFFNGRAPYKVANPRGWTYLYPPLFAMLLAPLHALSMPNQVTVWFFISLLFCWGCFRECCRLVGMACRENAAAAAAWEHFFPWLGVAAILTALLPTLNCLQRGQVGIVKLYLLLLGVRVILGGRTRWAWLAGGVVLALSIALKIVPLLPVGFLIFLLLIEGVRGRRRRLPGTEMLGRRWAFATGGVVIGLFLFFLLAPAALVGWRANLRHLDTWGRFMLTKADDGGMDPRSGNSHSVRNQSLQNASYRLGNFGAHLFSGGPDDRLVDNFDAPPMAMDSTLAERLLMLVRATISLALLALGVQLARGDGSRLDIAAGFSLACVAMLVVSPVGRGHYFNLVAPAVLIVTLWLAAHGRPRTAAWMAAVPPVICLLHYILLPYAGRVGLLGLGTTAWLLTAMVLMARADARSRPELLAPTTSAAA